MPIDLKKYPPYWKQFSIFIRLVRAEAKCEQCSVPNGKHICRGFFGPERRNPFWFDEDNGFTYHGETGKLIGRFRDYELNIERETTVVLTVAHLDQEGGVCDCEKRTGFKCANPTHVLALCQRCHLALDMPKHIANRNATLAARKDAERSLLV